ncbi:MAG: MarR family transcriptional regulator [Stellaceae bacterium]
MATIGDLATRLAIRHHSAVRLVDRLVAKALVRRRPATVDRRQIRLELTPRAETLLARLSVAHRDELERLAPLPSALLDAFGRPRELRGQQIRRFRRRHAVS